MGACLAFMLAGCDTDHCTKDASQRCHQVVPEGMGIMDNLQGPDRIEKSKSIPGFEDRGFEEQGFDDD